MTTAEAERGLPSDTARRSLTRLSGDESGTEIASPQFEICRSRYRLPASPLHSEPRRRVVVRRNIDPQPRHLGQFPGRPRRPVDLSKAVGKRRERVSSSCIMAYEVVIASEIRLPAADADANGGFFRNHRLAD